MRKLNLKWRNMLMLTIAGLINAFGVNVFLAPVRLYDSGISGTSMLLSQITPEWMSLSVFLIILNVPLFLYGLKKQPDRLFFCSYHPSFIYSETFCSPGHGRFCIL